MKLVRVRLRLHGVYLCLCRISPGKPLEIVSSWGPVKS